MFSYLKYSKKEIVLLFKHRNMKINEELQKVKTKDLLHDWKEDYRSTQQQLRRKRLVKGKGNLKKKESFSLFFFCLKRLSRSSCSSSIWN